MTTRTRGSLRALAALALLLMVGFAGPGCLVKKQLLDTALADISDLEGEVGALGRQLESCTGDLADTTDDLARTKGSLAECDARSAALAAERDALTAEASALRQTLDKRGAQLTRKQAEADLLASALDETQRAMEDMRARQQEAEDRNRIYQQLLDRFREMIDAGTLDVSIERGRLVINLKQDILFQSGKAVVGEEGQQTLLDVAAALAEIGDRVFQVEGHTDNVPIRTDRFPSNWELSTARATSVVKLLIEGGVSPTNLSAAGYGEFQPRADNDSDEGKALNRRIEIVMLPSLQALPDATPAG